MAPDASRPTLKIFDWRAGEHDTLRGSGASGARNAGAETTLGLSAEDEDDVYLAPETTCGGYVSEKLDVFSLADTPAENIRAGTPQYLDPFLRLRRPPRWDVYAERFAAAMTLHEMATGNLPGWGDGSTDPMLIEEEVTLDAEWLDPSVRGPLTEFFAKALARDYRARFDSAEEMRRAWSGCFGAIDVQATGDEEGGNLPSGLDGVTRETPLLAHLYHTLIQFLITSYSYDDRGRRVTLQSCARGSV